VVKIESPHVVDQKVALVGGIEKGRLNADALVAESGESFIGAMVDFGGPSPGSFHASWLQLYFDAFRFHMRISNSLRALVIAKTQTWGHVNPGGDDGKVEEGSGLGTRGACARAPLLSSAK